MGIRPVVLTGVMLALGWCGLHLQPCQGDDDPPAVETLDPVAPIQPRTLPSDRQQGKVRAAALFTRGCLAVNQKDYEKALRYFLAARRLDPERLPLLREIPPVAFKLKYNKLGVRYMVLLAEREPQTPQTLWQLATYLTENGQLQRAAGYYQKAFDLDKEKKPDAEIFARRVELGRLLFMVDDYTKAADSFALVLRALQDPEKFGLDPVDPLPALQMKDTSLLCNIMGECLFRAGRFDEALSAFEMANLKRKNPSLLAMHRARIAHRQKDRTSAERYTEECFAAPKPPVSDEPYRIVEQLMMTAPDTKPEVQRDKLEKKLAAMYKANPDNSLLGYYLAEKYVDWGKEIKAIQLYSDLIKDGPTIEAWSGLLDACCRAKEYQDALVLLYSIHQQMGDVSTLGEAFDRLLEDKVVVNNLVQHALDNVPGAPPKNTQPGPEFFPKIAMAHSGATLAMKKGRFGDAQKLFERARRWMPPPGRGELDMFHAQGLLDAGEGARAEKVLSRSLAEKAIASDLPSVLILLAETQSAAGHHDQALVTISRAVKANPQPYLRSRRAWLMVTAGRLEEAKKIYLALLEELGSDYNETQPRAIARAVRLSLAYLYGQQGKIADAEDQLETILDEFPEDTGAGNDLAFLWANQGKRLDLALAMTTRSVGVDPANAAYRDTLGWIHYKMGRPEEAVKQLLLAADLEKQDSRYVSGEILDHLAHAQLSAGLKSTALKTWRQAAAAFRTENEPEKARAVEAKIEKHK